MHFNANLRLSTSAISLLFVSASLLALARNSDIGSELVQIVTMVSGAAFFSGLGLFIGLASAQPSRQPLVARFDSEMIEAELEKVIDAELEKVIDVEYSEVHGFEEVAQVETYSDDDIILALAKVRIDFERELRKLAIKTQATRVDRHQNVRGLIDLLERSASVPPVVADAIRRVLPICDRAMHGELVSSSKAQKVINIARKVMLILRELSSEVSTNEEGVMRNRLDLEENY